MARVDRHGQPGFDKTGYFRMTQGEHEAMRSAAKVASMSLSAYVRQRLGLDASETRACIGTVARPPVLAALLLLMPVGCVRNSTALFGRPRGNT